MMEAQKKASDTRAAGAKILVVDDEVDVLRSTQMLLDRLGYSTMLLPDARHVIEVAEKEQPILILQDLVMPGLKLEELVGKLRGNPKTAKIPLVFFSASDDLAEQAAQMDAEGYLHKPFAEQQLREVLEHLIGPTPNPPRMPGRPAPAPVAQAEDLQARRKQQDAVRAYFHEYRNILTALNNYAQFLLNSPKVEDPEREAAEEINRLLLELEKKADALRQQLLEFVA